ncbi:CYTH domain-containing protein [Flavicella sediminum]|uniref:CYTH domain-containing protein n=1 Tax=Flavicella sediminum TaxID=2585141 RepID=UPI0011232292|nr:CYTH domain-containing protein [Flavicella sediminum]
MNVEIERKFLVKTNAFIKESYQKNHIEQGFLNSNKNRVVRVRIKDETSYLTIKGLTSKSGTTRFEWEKEIALEDGKQLLEICEQTIIQKIRYLVKHKKHVYEIDVFLGENEGLIVAEIELSSEDEHFEKPEWLGAEVTGITKYYNSQLSVQPFKNWS